MRWQAKKWPPAQRERIVKRFLLLPVCLNRQRRWFETAYVLQEYLIGSGPNAGSAGWFCVKWATKEEWESKNLNFERLLREPLKTSLQIEAEKLARKYEPQPEEQQEVIKSIECWGHEMVICTPKDR